MRQLLLAAASLAALASSAQALTFTVTAPTDADYTLFNDFIGQTDFEIPGGKFFGDAVVYPAAYSESGVTLAPLPVNAYMAVTGDERLELLSPQTSFSLVWGSPDAYNDLYFLNASGVTYHITGSTVQAAATLYQAGAALVTLTDLPAFTALEFVSRNTNQTTQPAFEFQLAGSAPATPEASTWVMLGLGFAAMGYVGRQKARTARALA